MGEDVQFILTLRGQLRLGFQIQSGIDSQQQSFGLVTQLSLLTLRYEPKRWLRTDYTLTGIVFTNHRARPIIGK